MTNQELEGFERLSTMSGLQMCWNANFCATVAWNLLYCRAVWALWSYNISTSLMLTKLCFLSSLWQRCYKCVGKYGLQSVTKAVSWFWTCNLLIWHMLLLDQTGVEDKKVYWSLTTCSLSLYYFVFFSSTDICKCCCLWCPSLSQFPEPLSLSALQWT